VERGGITESKRGDRSKRLDCPFDCMENPRPRPRPDSESLFLFRYAGVETGRVSKFTGAGFDAIEIPREEVALDIKFVGLSGNNQLRESFKVSTRLFESISLFALQSYALILADGLGESPRCWNESNGDCGTLD
jgi:hypothetical protein